MTEPEYRQDDRTDVGFCPRCGQPLSAMTTGARGYCETHGWQYADWHGSPGPTYLRPTDEREAQP